MGRHRKIAVLFDVDDTLYDQTMPFVQAYGKYFGDALPVSAEELFPVTRKYSNAVFSRALAGEITMEDLYICRLKKALEEFGVEISEQEALTFQQVYEECQKHIRMTPLMEEILAWCADRALLGIITNGLSGHQWEKIRGLRAERWIPEEYIFVSGDVGAVKPDRQIFDYARKRMHMEEGEIWFVGDAFDLDVEGAMNAGWNAVWMNRRGRKRPDGAEEPAYEARTEAELFQVMKKIAGGYHKLEA